MQERPAPAPRPLDLTAWRQKRGMSLEEIAESTKISVAYLRAIEEGRFEVLPGGIYDINYLRQYARAIGFDEEVLVAHYRTVTGQDAPPPRPAEHGRPRHWLRGPASLLRGLI